MWNYLMTCCLATHFPVDIKHAFTRVRDTNAKTEQWNLWTKVGKVLRAHSGCKDPETDADKLLFHFKRSGRFQPPLMLSQVIEVLDLKVHEYFGHNTNRDNDVAILILKENVVFGQNVKKIVLVEPGMAIRVGTILEVSGWGSTNLKPQFTNVLLRSNMMVINRFECNRVYPHRMTSSNFCVRYQSERKLSDNGGPATYNEMLVGIVSSGAARSQAPYVAVLTNVSYFNRWIVLNSKKLLEKYCVNPKFQENIVNEYDSGIMTT